MKRLTHFTTLTIAVLLCLVWDLRCAQPPLMLRKADLEQIKKAEIYLNKQLQMYERRRADNYTLYLAVKNYADRLNSLQQQALIQFEINSVIQKGNNKINKVLVGSSKTTGAQSSYDLVQKSQLDSSKNYLYFKKWKIDTHNILDIQEHPETVISYNKPQPTYSNSYDQKGLFGNLRYLMTEDEPANTNSEAHKLVSQSSAGSKY